MAMHALDSVANPEVPMQRIHLLATRVFVLSIVAAAVCLLCGSRSSAQSQNNIIVDQKLYQDLRWRSIGPARGGRVTAVSGGWTQPNTFYMGTVGGGVWKTTNFGIS